MRTNLLLTVLILIATIPSFAQHFSHGIGVGNYYYTDNVYDREMGIAITYSSVCYFAEEARTSFSVGLPVSFGIGNGIFGFKSQLADGTYRESNHNFMLNIPILINFNMGAGAAKDAGHYGFFVGMGPGFNMSPVSYFQYKGEDTQNGKDKRSVIGLNCNVGLRILPCTLKKHHENVEFKLSLFASGYRTSPFITSLNCIYNF